MERRLNSKLEAYIIAFKNDIVARLQEVSGDLTSDHSSQIVADSRTKCNAIIGFVYNYEKIKVGKDDFMKRKRVKSVVPIYDRCCAKRASDEQCTRRKKDGCEFCGTHLKGTPHGVVDESNEPKNNTQKVDVWAQDIQGIVYYIDKNMNVYQAEDIISNKVNPKIIAKYFRDGETYSIPEFSI